jgi:hypothetical protein
MSHNPHVRKSYLPERWWGVPLQAAIIVGVVCFPAVGQEPEPLGPVVRVEQDWELVVNEPNEHTYSPQYHTVMSPFGHLDSYYAQVTWNYKQETKFILGGLQLQCWDSSTLVRTRGIRTAPLSTESETIVWTQVLWQLDDLLVFRIIDGQSTSWGWFGRDMAIDQTAALPDLEGYSTEVSVRNSWITFGANRVDSMVIKQVRMYDANDNLVRSEDTPRVVYRRAN